MNKFLFVLLALIASIVPVAAGPSTADAVTETPQQTVTVTIPGETIPVTFIVDSRPLSQLDAEAANIWFSRYPRLTAENRKFLRFIFPLLINSGALDSRDSGGRIVLNQDPVHYFTMGQTFLACVNMRLRATVSDRTVTVNVPITTRTIRKTKTCYVPCASPAAPCVPMSYAESSNTPDMLPYIITVQGPTTTLFGGAIFGGAPAQCQSSTPGQPVVPAGCTPHPPATDMNPGTGQLTTPQVPHGVGIYR